MKRRTKGAVIFAVSVVLVFFFFAPVVYWKITGISVGPGTRTGVLVSVYRSAGCIFFGYGDIYVGGLGTRWGCDVPPIPTPF